jgi:hypothetical protein
MLHPFLLYTSPRKGIFHPFTQGTTLCLTQKGTFSVKVVFFYVRKVSPIVYNSTTYIPALITKSAEKPQNLLDFSFLYVRLVQCLNNPPKKRL